MSRGNLAIALTIFALGFASGQTRPQPTNPPEPEKAEAPKTPAAVAPDATGLPIDPKSYVIGPEDIILIKVWREPDFTGPKGVRPDGKITLPLIGDLQAGGLTPDRLTAQLKQALSEYVKQPDVTVEVIQVNSKRYTVTGEVNRPNAYPMVVAVHVFDAINIAGGFREFANKKDILVLRGDGKRFHFNYQEYVKGKNVDKNILLENGDTVIVK
ncbi:MAG TPA: polysaccharide biosynthesis/export family protein [Bryobacteraceae bacterium]|nr:polysaccharide biosynthesis/export family protein [Bryobacteraceae bacterium]